MAAGEDGPEDLKLAAAVGVTAEAAVLDAAWRLRPTPSLSPPDTDNLEGLKELMIQMTMMIVGNTNYCNNEKKN